MNEVNVETEQTEQAPSAGLSVHTLVADRLKQGGGKVIEDRLVELLTEKELEKRTQAALLCVEHLEKARSELRRIKPDNVLYNEDGSTKDFSYKKETTDKIKQLKDRIARGTKAYGKAIESGEFKDVYEFNQKCGGAGKAETAG